MTIEAMLTTLIKKGVIRVSEEYDYDPETNTSTERKVVKTAGCGCCSDVADLPAGLTGLILAVEHSL